MSYIIISINAVLLILLVIWAVSLRKKELFVEDYKEQMRLFLQERKKDTKKVRCVYHLTESDFNKKPVRMVREARESIEGSIGRRVVKEVGLDEIIKDGMLVGYKFEIEVRKIK